MSPFIRSRRLDKLSVLKMTVQYMKTMRSTSNSYTEGRYKHPLISDKDLSNLINKVSLVLRSRCIIYVGVWDSAGEHAETE